MPVKHIIPGKIHQGADNVTKRYIECEIEDYRDWIDTLRAMGVAAESGYTCLTPAQSAERGFNLSNSIPRFKKTPVEAYLASCNKHGAVMQLASTVSQAVDDDSYTWEDEARDEGFLR